MKPTRHIIVDLETLDTQPSAVILTAGLVAVEITETECITLGSWYRPFLWDHPQHNQSGRSTSQDTADWWGNQSDAALSEAFCNDYDALPISIALHSLNVWLQLNPYPIWGNGSDFDNAVLQHAFKQQGLRWPYWRNCCLRSTKNLAKQLGLQVEMPAWLDGKIKHHALHDAEHEAQMLAALLRAFSMPSQVFQIDLRGPVTFTVTKEAEAA